MKRVLILGINGFIGHHLTRRILESTDWEVYGMDMQSDRLTDLFGDPEFHTTDWEVFGDEEGGKTKMRAERLKRLFGNPRFHFVEGDIMINKEWIEYHVKKSDVVLPLVAIATPASYVKHPLRTFELDFEANLPIVRMCVKYGKRLVFPSTSEVYGMCEDEQFDPYASPLVLGPIDKQRWIYSASKQLMDRVIWAYGFEQGLDFTLFRPFNWIGTGLDRLSATKEGGSRVVTQFLGQMLRGEDIKLVDGGTQKRAFTYVSDGVDALIRIIENKDGVASGKIYNIGNPKNNISIRELAERMVALAKEYPEYRNFARRTKIIGATAEGFYGKGYQDVLNRVPKIENTMEELRWRPKVDMETSLRYIFDGYREEVREAQSLADEFPKETASSRKRPPTTVRKAKKEKSSPSTRRKK